MTVPFAWCLLNVNTLINLHKVAEIFLKGLSCLLTRCIFSSMRLILVYLEERVRTFPWCQIYKKNFTYRLLVMDNPPLSPNRKLSNTLKDLILTKKIIQIRRWSFLILVSRKVSTGLLKFPRRVCLCSGAVQCFMVCI